MSESDPSCANCGCARARHQRPNMLDGWCTDDCPTLCTTYRPQLDD